MLAVLVEESRAHTIQDKVMKVESLALDRKGISATALRAIRSVRNLHNGKAARLVEPERYYDYSTYWLDSPHLRFLWPTTWIQKDEAALTPNEE